MKKILTAFLLFIMATPATLIAKPASSIYDITATAANESAARNLWTRQAGNFIVTKYCNGVSGTIQCVAGATGVHPVYSVVCANRTVQLDTDEFKTEIQIYCKRMVDTFDESDASVTVTTRKNSDSNVTTPVATPEPSAPVATPATTSSTSSASSITISGTVYVDGEPQSGVTLAPKGASDLNNFNTATSAEGGHFTISKFPVNNDLVAMWYSEDDQTISYADIESNTSNVNVYIDATSTIELEAYTVTATNKCTTEETHTALHAKSAKFIQTGKTLRGGTKESICIPTECVDNSYILENPDTPNAICTKCIEKIQHALQATVSNGKCIVTDNQCSLGYRPSSDGTRCDDIKGKNCDKTDWGKIEYANGGHYEIRNNKLVCKPTCNGTNYEARWDNNADTYKCNLKSDRANTPCTNDEIKKLISEKKLHEHATAGTVNEWNQSTATVTSCTITACQSGWIPSKKTNECIKNTCTCGHRWNSDTQKCDSIIGQKCDAPNAHDAKIACKPNNDNGTEICEIQENGCNGDYKLDVAKNVCVSRHGEDCKGTLPADSHASVASLDKNRKCIIMACEDGYNLVGKGEKAKCEARKVASEEEVKELKENAQKMEENKNSLVNRTIGAAGIGAVGIGGMMAAGALAEQAADQEAEEAMRAYLNTFSCEYGSNQRVSGGTIGIEIPGGNDMFNLYAQYAQLANDLKIRKAALGIKPGIESEVIIDKATTGLYDDVGTGITGGNYASVARALTDPNSEDAKRWNEQKEKTASNLKTGAITAGAGAAVSLAANLAVNTRKDKQDKTDEILSKYNRTTPDEKTDASSEETNTPSDAAVIPAVDEDQNTPTGAAQVGTFKENQNIEPVTDISPAAEVKEQDPECDPSLAWNNMRGNKSLQNRYAQYSRGIHQDSTRSAEQDAQLNKIKQICIGAKGKWEEKIQDLGDFAVANTTFLDCKKNGTFDTACLDKKSEQYKTALLNVCGTHNTFKTFICDFGSPDRTHGSVRCQNTFNKKTGNIEWTQTHASLDKLLQLSRTPVEQWRDKEDNYDACMFFTD